MRETRHEIPNVKLRSEEVQELMGKMPPAILRTGISLLFAFVIVIVAACLFIRYPDVIPVPIVAKNVNRMAGIKAARPGMLVCLRIGHGMVCKGETLAMMIADSGSGRDTIHVTSPLAGVVYPCETFHESDYVEKGMLLYVVVDSIKDKIQAKAFVTADMKSRISEGMDIESSIRNVPVAGKVTSIANHGNPYDGKYAISMEFDTPEALGGTVVWNAQANAKIKVNESSVLEKFFKSITLPYRNP